MCLFTSDFCTAVQQLTRFQQVPVHNDRLPGRRRA